MQPISYEENHLEVYSESRKRKIFVGTLAYDPKTKVYCFEYSRKYQLSKGAIPLGPELSLKQRKHVSPPNRIFLSFEDRIPSRKNPAYVEYCRAFGIGPEEKNLITLLGTIGRRGPSTFVFERVPVENKDVIPELRALMKKLELSTWDLAAAFDIPELTIQRVLLLKSRDRNILSLLDLILRYPEVSLYKIAMSGRRLPGSTRERMEDYFKLQVR